MGDHDSFRDLVKSKELIEKISPKFSELTLDIQELFEKSKDPVLLSVLLFKLAEEREKTNKLLEGINDKYDKLMFEFKTREIGKEAVKEEEKHFTILPEADQKILKEVEKRKSITAEEIQGIMNYRGRNAASQRLNKLVRDGYLKKVQSGKKVLFLSK